MPGDEMRDADEESFGQWLRGELRARGWSQADLGRAISRYADVEPVDPSSLSRYTRDLQRPDPRQAESIARALGVPAQVDSRHNCDYNWRSG